MHIYLAGSATIVGVDELLMQRKLTMRVVHENLAKAQRMWSLANNHRQDCIFHAGEWVYVRLQPWVVRQTFIQRRPFPKLAPRFYGPFLILRSVGKVAYKLGLPQLPESIVFFMSPSFAPVMVNYHSKFLPYLLL